MTRPEVATLLALADEDLEVARKLLSDHPRQAALHLQQAAEKLAKAVLVAEGLAAPRIHQLGALTSLLPAEHLWRSELASLDRLSSHATALRYPDPAGSVPAAPEAAELARDLQEVAALLDEIGHWCLARKG